MNIRKIRKITIPVSRNKTNFVRQFVFALLIFFSSGFACATGSQIKTGAEQPELYLPALAGKNVALMVNQTSMVGDVHLVDFLMLKGIRLKKVFSVEHGFRGNVANGEQISSSIDEKTELPIISLYGEKKKPSATDLKGIDVVVFDIQDVGCRFYTYISSLHYLMEACADNGVLLLILDRPNPNGDYVDGPVLKPEFKSFVGMHSIPVVHGCTVGELAAMINGEGWLSKGVACKLEIVKVKNYTHSDKYIPPVKPSPNLPNYQSIRLYPSLCLFEAANVSIGRGTDMPFQVIGYPGFSKGDITFTPQSIPGVSNDPIFKGKECNGIDLQNLETIPTFTLSFFIDFFKDYSSSKFWSSERWIGLLMGNSDFYNQINSGMSEAQIRETWLDDLNKYKLMRKKYLLYPDFE